MGIKLRLTAMNFLQFAVWGSYLTCIGNFLGRVGLGGEISWFYVVQGIVSIFMPAIVGAIADKFVQPQRMLGISHLIAGGLMLAAGIYAQQMGQSIEFAPFFAIYTLSVAFYMPTLALSNTVAFSILSRHGFDTVKDFPPIRVFGTIGFIAAMWFVNFAKFGMEEPFQFTYMQLVTSGLLGILLAIYSFTLPSCPLVKGDAQSKKSLVQRLGLDAFVLFKQKKMALFFIFSMLLGVSLQITNGFAGPYINSFAAVSDSWFAKNPTLLTSLSQASEALCILLIPFCLKRFGIKKVMLIAMFAWVLRFGFFGVGSTETVVGLIALFASMIVYGVAFDFFNVSGALFVERESDKSMQASAQGLFMLMTNGIGASVGTWLAGKVVNHFCAWNTEGFFVAKEGVEGGWPAVWGIFAAYALVVALMFAIVFKYKHTPAK
ncbi:MAG: MFS transporter [Rikenellaceae bacterium]|nr:MFS transporter [Rikenellaceae bacterium]